MNEYYKLAAEYFKEFEPRSAFPGLNSYHWYLWAVSFAFFVYFGFDYFFGNAPSSLKQGWKMFAAEAVFLVSCLLIGIKRFRLIVGTTSDDSSVKPAERLATAKRARLEKLLNRPAWEFMATTREIIELRALEKACSPASDKYLGELWRKIYDPESKARLLTLLTALLGLVTAVLGKNGAFDLIEALNDESIWILIKAMSMLIAVVFIVCIAAYHAFRQFLELLPALFSSLFPALHSRQTTLDYFIRDLIQYHRMAPSIAAAAAPAHAQPRESVLGTVIAAVCLLLLRLPSESKDPQVMAPVQPQRAAGE